MSADPQAPDVAGTVFDTDSAEIARSYAQALLNLMDESDKGEALLGELEELVADVWDQQPDFAALIGGGFLPEARRDELIVELLNGRTDDLLVHFVRVVNRRNRLSLVPQIAYEARQVWDRRHQVVEVTAHSAVELDEGQRQAVLERLKAFLPGRNPRLTTVVDPSILGGLVIQVGDQMLDASIQTRLRKIREQMLAARHREIRGRRDELAGALDPA